MGASTPAMVVQYAELAKRIGTMLSTITTGVIKSVEVAYRGTIAEFPCEAVTTAFSIGLLQPHFDMPVNIVNVGLLAKERGISIDQVKNPEAKNVESSFTAKVVTDKVTRTICGTVFAENVLRVIEVDDFKIEVATEGTMLVIFNEHKPGVIGSVGTICGKHGINICTMGVGQKPAQGKAILAVTLDKQPSKEVVAELSKLDFVNEIYVCKLN